MKSAAAVKPARPPALGPVVAIPLAAIVALDPCNARRAEPPAANIAELAEAIRADGLLHPLILRPASAPREYNVLAGGRRWRALKLIGEAASVLCRVFLADDDSALELSLRENIDRDDPHPLMLADDVAQVARARGREAAARSNRWPLRFIDDQLRLSALPAVARAAWLAGDIGEPQARALTFGAAAEIEALFAHPQAKAILSDVRQIRIVLRPGAVSANAPAARFVGPEAYVKAGGDTHNDFETGEWLLDGALLRRLERQKLAAEADAIQKAEGWGTILFDSADATNCVQPHFTGGEQTRLDQIEAEIETATGEDAVAGLHEQAEALRRRGVLREISESDRAKYGVYVGLDSEGRLDVVRGVRTPSEIVGGTASHSAATQTADAAASDKPTEAAEPTRRPRPAPEAQAQPILSARGRRLIAKTATKAMAQQMGGLLIGDVLRVVCAGMASREPTPVGITRRPGPGGRAGSFVLRLAKLDFPAIMDALAEAADPEVEDAFAEIAAVSFVPEGQDFSRDARALFKFFASINEDVAPVFAATFDYAGFFAGEGRAVSLDAIRDCGGPAAVGDRSWMSDEKLAAEAALLAKAASWLPAELRVER